MAIMILLHVKNRGALIAMVCGSKAKRDSLTAQSTHSKVFLRIFWRSMVDGYDQVEIF